MNNRSKMFAFLPVLGLALLLGAGSEPSWGEPLSLGTSPAAVLTKIGVPDDVNFSAQGMTFVYRGKDQKTHRFVFHERVAIQVPKNGFQVAAVQKLPNNEAYSGQSVAAAVKRLGSPVEVTRSSGGLHARYASGTEAMFAHGYVAVAKPR